MGGLAHNRRRPQEGEAEITAADRKVWRAWLRRHHGDRSAVWLVFYKKGSGVPSVSYREALEEAICHGWIDGKKRSLDEQRYAHRYTPRKEESRWSPRNLEIAAAMIAAGRMHPAGLAAHARRQEYAPSFLAARRQREAVLIPGIEKKLRAHGHAWRNFMALPPGRRRQYVAWLNSARRPETRDRRLQEALRLLAENLPLGMK